MFTQHTHNSITYLRSDILGGVRHGFSTRPGGVSPQPWDSLNLGVGRGDDMDNVRENYRRFCAVLGLDDRRAVLSRQVHEDVVRCVTAQDEGKGLYRERDYASVDGLVTDVAGLPLVVFSADCNVILLHDPVRGAVGACHAGWRGTALGIARKTVEEMVRLYGCDPTHIRAAVGPAIGQCCFETDSDVPEALHRALGAEAAPYIVWNGKKFHIDLKAVNALWLRKAGVETIDICHHCTACRSDLYWSHRRMGNERGAQIAMIAAGEVAE
ncbi:MAG: peptidoglycan editing factor PgeF [Oscillospiraceae bacterium]|nr:peptidoglycan editing factor PgeF [Oscillospiraceae bacterium]